MRISDWSSDVCSSDLWVVASGFRAQPGGFCLLPGADGSLEEVLLAIDPEEPLWSFAGLPAALPPGVYRIDHGLRPGAASRAAPGWCLGSYAFTRYTNNARKYPRRVRAPAADAQRGLGRGGCAASRCPDWWISGVGVIDRKKN